MKNARRNSTWLLWLAAAAFLSAVCMGKAPLSVTVPQAVSAGWSAFVGSSSPGQSSESGALAQACELIYQGKFDAANELIQQTRKSQPTQLSTTTAQLSQIVEEYGDISEQRKSAQKAAYAETLDELEKLKTKADANDVNDVNDVNDIISVLSVVVRAGEFADQKQKDQLLADPFVKETVQKAVDKAAGFEVDGKWLEAYTNCYYWLVAIDPNNQGYSDYAEQLLDKATVAMAFEDSPCETSKERFQGVQESMFLRAVDFLDTHYVNNLDYSQMATKGVERCKLLAEVIAAEARSNDSPEGEGKNTLSAIKDTWEPGKLSAWSSAMQALLDETKAASGGLTGLDKKEFMAIVEKVLKINDSTVALPQPVLIAQFAEASLSALDPYTVIVWPKNVQDFEQMMTNEFMGIGIEISKQQGQLTVSSLLLDTPAFNSTLDAGDVIEAVEGIPTKDMSLACAAKKIKGPAGTKVKLKVRRPSANKKIPDKVFDVTITRDRIIVPTVRGWQRTKEGKWLYFIDEKNRIGFVRLTSFSSDTAPGLEQVLQELETEGLNGLILDLRFNTGGLLDSAVDVVDKFVAEDLIVKRQPGLGRMPSYELAHKKGTHPNYPLVILVNSGSASASEIVAGALADKVHHRAILVGNRTHGKGSVQGITGWLGGGAQLKYTMAYYHLPSGQRVESREEVEKEGRKDWGVAPNVEVKLRSDELKKMIEVQRHNDVLVKADRDNANHDFTKHTVEQTLADDPQLAVALLVVRSKLLEAQTLASAKMNN
ncbi:MAG: S41 family peptidase [Planctomycetota bacterium]